jgi:hypothetical protein
MRGVKQRGMVEKDDTGRIDYSDGEIGQLRKGRRIRTAISGFALWMIPRRPGRSDEDIHQSMSRSIPTQPTMEAPECKPENKKEVSMAHALINISANMEFGEA